MPFKVIPNGHFHPVSLQWKHERLPQAICPVGRAEPAKPAGKKIFTELTRPVLEKMPDRCLLYGYLKNAVNEFAPLLGRPSTPFGREEWFPSVFWGQEPGVVKTETRILTESETGHPCNPIFKLHMVYIIKS
jgi:hypothetical protein